MKIYTKDSAEVWKNTLREEQEYEGGEKLFSALFNFLEWGCINFALLRPILEFNLAWILVSSYLQVGPWSGMIMCL